LETIKMSFDILDGSIRCSSLTGYQLRGGLNIAATLQEEIRGAQAVVAVLTPNSMASPWVLCELGAVWGLVSNCVPVIAGLDPNSLSGPLGVTHVWRLDNIDDVRSALGQLGSHLGASVPRLVPTKRDEDDTLERLVALSSKHRPDTDMISTAALYSLHSLSDEVAENHVFQDFDVSRNRGGNPNAVHSMWTDTFANGNLRASVVMEPSERYLRIWFENGTRSEQQSERAKGWSSNIAIRPRGPVANEGEPGELRHKGLQFFVRAPEGPRQDGDIDEIGLSLRILDRRLTYWVYTTLPQGKGPTQLRVTSSWQCIRVDLSPRSYGMYTGDGNRRYPKRDTGGTPVPDFTIITGMTVVLGRYTAGREEPQEGKGVIDIKDIQLCD
jgi:hypothetical protein